MSNRDSRKSLYRDATRAVLLGLMINLALGIVKLVGGLVANSFALLSDAINSLGDSFASIVVLVALAFAQRPADKDHPRHYSKRAASTLQFLHRGCRPTLGVEPRRSDSNREKVAFSFPLV